MARKGLLVNAGEEKIHSDEITLTTGREKAKNWWYYNKFILLGILIAIGVAFSIAYSILSKEKYDYTIAVVSQLEIDEEALGILSDHIAQYGEDLDGDGEVTVSVLNYSVRQSDDDNEYNAYAYQAAYAQYAADMTSGDSIIWLYDSTGESLMGELDGIFMDIGGSDVSWQLDWEDVPGLYSVDFSSYDGDIYTPENMVQVFSLMKVSVRQVEGTTLEGSSKSETYQENCVKLFENLMQAEN